MEPRNQKFPVLRLKGELAPWPLDEDFRRDWSELLFSLPYKTPFCRLEWIETGISVYGENIQMVPCRFYDPAGVLQAIGLFSKLDEPGRFLPHTVIRTIEYNSQRIFPLLAKNVSIMAEALRTFRNSFDFHVDYYDFYKLDPMGKDLEELAMDLDSMKLTYELEVFNEQPQFNLDLTWDDYLTGRTQGHRKKIRRYTRLLQEQYPDYQFTRLRTPEEFEAYGLEKVLDTILDLYNRSWQSEYLTEHGNLASKMSDFYCRIARTFAPLGLLDICLLEADNTLLAYELNLVEEGSIFMLFGTYNQEYSQWSPGNAILSEIIQDSIKRGYSLLEFGGEYLEYKKLWTKQSTNSYHLRLYGNTLHSKVKCLLKKKK
ncbi:GNAT family N-acetyltransferase [uncultured Sphaerochaeta sp.]|uniref:GNAT family N-acetyltransferase n=1 Tax=uncultured Sphaerochaeta sp. TaxID=886478 RepID=UPI002A0A61E9|nr:GNAT family N-acetyltransferase [uncultured Sphaerochaeta sp.]